jgi:cytochrome c biogenesis protein CcmG, thiol:disulfide interchange protein DsbE
VSEQRRPRHPARWAALALAAALIALVVVLAGAEESGTRAADSPLLGKPAPEIIADTIDGERYRASRDRGKWLVVNFFATWCVPCRQEHPDLIRFQERHAKTGDATIIGVIYGDTPEATKAFRDENGGDWPMLVDPGGRISVAFGVRGVPESFLISPDGTVVSKIIGGIDAPALERILQEARGS